MRETYLVPASLGTTKPYIKTSHEADKTVVLESHQVSRTGKPITHRIAMHKTQFDHELKNNIIQRMEVEL